MNGKEYGLCKDAALLVVLKGLDPDLHDRCFIRSHRHAYHFSESEMENRMRNLRYHALKDRLENRK